jgi:hypothetical protein
MFVDKLGLVIPRQGHAVVVESRDVPLQSDATPEEDCHWHTVLLNVLQERILQGRGALLGHGTLGTISTPTSLQVFSCIVAP